MTPRSLTCGARLHVTKPLRAQALAAAPGLPGSALSSLSCALGEHPGGEPHAGVVRRPHARTFPPPEEPATGSLPTAVWARWSTRDDRTQVRCTAEHTCARSDGPTPCALYPEHPGPCSFALDDTPATDPTREQRALAAHAALAAATSAATHDPAALHAAALDAALLTWDELRARRIWHQLPPWDQAAVLRIVSHAKNVHPQARSVAHAAALATDLAAVTALWADGSAGMLPHGPAAVELHARLLRLPTSWQGQVIGSQRASRGPHDGPRTPLADAIRYAEGTCPQPPPKPTLWWEPGWDTADDYRLGHDLSTRLARLPEEWQVDVIRAIAAGATALAAVSDAGMAINLLRSFGVHLAWCARAESEGPAADQRSEPM